MKLYIHAEALEHIREETERARPNECCGALVGFEDTYRIVCSVLPCADGDTKGYAIPPSRWDEIAQKLEGTELRIVGIYHSHPHGPSIPSDLDQERAKPVWSYIIVSGATGAVQSWRLIEGVFVEEEVESWKL